MHLRRVSDVSFSGDLIEANELGPEGAKVVGKLLCSMTSSIRLLNVDTNELGDEGVCALLEPFAAARSTLEDLSLNTNEIEASGARAILQATLPNLKRLSLDDNFDMPKKDFKGRFGSSVVNFEDEEDDEAVDKLTSMFAAM